LYISALVGFLRKISFTLFHSQTLRTTVSTSPLRWNLWAQQ